MRLSVTIRPCSFRRSPSCASVRGVRYPAAQHAEERGADAVLAMRYDATEFSQGVTEVLAYGTAVKLRR